MLVAVLTFELSGFCARGSAEETAIKPFKLEQICRLLKDVKPADVVKQIHRYKVDFQLDKSANSLLTDCGAPSSLLDEIESNPLKDMYIFFPPRGGQVVHYIQVQGWSKPFSGKHLWLFTHQKGLDVWWPQGEVSKIEEGGSWKHELCIGRAEDKGPNFEIRAMWIDQDLHDDLQKFLLCKGKDDRCPDRCAGSQLPEGDPEDQVIVRRLD